MPVDSSPPDQPAVAVTALVKRYRGATAVDGLTLTAPTGQVTALLGPNGAGKTTTVECCEGLRRADGGTVRVLGLDPATDAKALRPRVGVMLQDGGLPTTVRAEEVLRHVSTMYARPRDPGELSERLGLGGFARTQVRRLSGGERQRLALATAVVGRPELVFLDEPSAGMDPQARLAVWDLVRELREDGTTIVLTTHQMAEAEALADHVAVVDHGTTVAAGTVAELVGSNASIRVRVTGHHEDRDLASALRTALAGTGTATDVDVSTCGAPDTLEVTGAVTPQVVHAVTGWAHEHDLLVRSLTTGRRTLEDVFLDLTGRSLR
ncbi:ABC transporter ATP-binding protein [Cellulomonas bogoriensis]|uniref:Spermidine/putrescine ABC transporter ATP-binding protein n=1 Tax=Cellulomonas bogoriensis 69B4 = DSM 16987 TaxID=1386082 RepID=A0A0A0C2U6_9CELL|nr:ABC transporter ATP-binding protein [Cellulomonas bogoriensis]KGM13669.1 spermidine/putrescine ABC transporter ATP-binding protein [Cellulomonas bogoriensis 69B4 = DSM 16987]